MDTERIREFLERGLEQILALGSDVNILSQLLAAVGGLVIAYFTHRRLQAAFLNLHDRFPGRSPFAKAFEILAALSLPLIWLTIEFAILAIFQGVGPPSHIISAICSLLVAWIVINVVTSLAENKIWARLVAFCAWTIAALNICLLYTSDAADE